MMTEEKTVKGVKDVTEVKVGDYTVSLSEENVAMMHDLYNNRREREQLQQVSDFLLECACGTPPSDEDCLKHMKMLHNIRGWLDYFDQTKMVRK